MQGATRLPRFGRVRPGTRSGAVLAGVLAVLAFGCSGTRAAADPGPASAGGIEEQPLAPRSGPRGKTLFTVIPPEESGVRTENTYDDPEIWGRLSREFDLGAVGTGAAIGDYDNDGLPDIFVVSKTGSCRLFHNLGNWKFEDVTEKAGVGDHGAAARIWKQGATFVDVNNDGLLDIYVCRFNAPNLLYINQGDGTFKEEAHAYGLDVTDGSVMAYFYDYDRDGWLDVFIQTNVLDAAAHPEGQRDYLFHNNRNGTFTNVTDRAGVVPGRAHGNSAVWWDFDGDGWPGLYVANDFDVPDALYRNNRDGTFTDVIAHLVPHTPYSSMGSDPGEPIGRPGSTNLIRLHRLGAKLRDSPGGHQRNFIRTSIRSGANLMYLPVMYIGLEASLHISVNWPGLPFAAFSTLPRNSSISRWLMPKRVTAKSNRSEEHTS